MTSLFPQASIKHWAVIRIDLLEQSCPLKAKILFWMDRIIPERTLSKSAPRLQRKEDTPCLQFRVVVGVHPALLQQSDLPCTENLQLVRTMAKADDGPIKFMSPKVKLQVT